MTALVCITNDDPTGRPCTIRGEHLVTCQSATCTGCHPKPAERGLLCFDCWRKLEDALAHAAHLIWHLRSIETGGSSGDDRVSSSRSWKIPIPASWLVADELMVALGAPPVPSTAGIDRVKVLADDAVAPWAAAETHVATVEGALQGVAFYRLVQTALARWPDKSTERTIGGPIRCPDCRMLGLTYRPPLEYLDRIEVKCTSCGQLHDWFEFAGSVAAMVTAATDAQKNEDRRRRSAAKRAREQRELEAERA